MAKASALGEAALPTDLLALVLAFHNDMVLADEIEYMAYNEALNACGRPCMSGKVAELFSWWMGSMSCTSAVRVVTLLTNKSEHVYNMFPTKYHDYIAERLTEHYHNSLPFLSQLWVRMVLKGTALPHAFQDPNEYRIAFEITVQRSDFVPFAIALPQPRLAVSDFD